MRPRCPFVSIEILASVDAAGNSNIYFCAKPPELEVYLLTSILYVAKLLKGLSVSVESFRKVILSTQKNNMTDQ